MYRSDIIELVKDVSPDSKYPCGFINREEYSIFYVCKGTEEEVLLNALQMYLGCELGSGTQVVCLDNDTLFQLSEILRVWQERGYKRDTAYVIRQAVNRMYHFVVGMDSRTTNNSSKSRG